MTVSSQSAHSVARRCAAPCGRGVRRMDGRAGAVKRNPHLSSNPESVGDTEPRQGFPDGGAYVVVSPACVRRRSRRRAHTEYSPTFRKMQGASPQSHNGVQETAGRDAAANSYDLFSLPNGGRRS